MNGRFLLAALFVACLSSGCLVHHYGDAKLQENSDAVSITRDRLWLKPIPLNHAVVHVRQVRNLPFAIYPTHLRIPLTPIEAELRQNMPWEKVRLRVDFRAPDGKTFFSKEVSLAKVERGRAPGTYHQIDVLIRRPDERPWRAPEDMPHHTDYDVVTTVLEPSANPKQRAFLYGDTYVK